MSPLPRLVAVDWGSSRFRAFLLNDTGELLDTVENDKGVFGHEGKGFEDSLLSSCGKWLSEYAKIPILMAGMIGSRAGWLETEYLSCPVSPRSVSASLVRGPDIASHPVYLVPGVTVRCVTDNPDVMRGEETQTFGALGEDRRSNAAVVVPGTHSKWIRFEGGKISSFATFMTGELFGATRKCQSLQFLDDDFLFDKTDFLKGVGVSKKRGGLLHHLFSIRAHAMLKPEASNPNPSYMLGLLVGREIRSGLEVYPDVSSVLLIGTGALIRDYQLAFSSYDLPPQTCESDQATIAGLWKFATMSGIAI